MHSFRYGRPVALALLLFASVARAEDPACTQGTICTPTAGSVWLQDREFASVIWNPANMTPFDQYEKVDVYLVDDTNRWQLQLQAEADLNIGMLAKRKDPAMFPEFLPINRSCKIVFTSLGQPLDGTHRTLNSSTFYLIRTQFTVNGTLTPLPPSSIATALPTISTTSSALRSPSPTTTFITDETPPTFPPMAPVPPDSSTSHSSLSSLAIGLIAAGSFAIIIAAVAIAQVFRTRRRYMRHNANFKTLPEPTSPTDGSLSRGGAGSAISSEPKSDLEGLVAPGMAGMGAAFAVGRNSSNTIRSNTAMIQGAHALSGYSTPPDPPAPTIPTIVVPLLERRPSTVTHEPSRPTSSSSLMEKQSQAEARYSGGGASSSSLGVSGGRLSLEPVISAGDARLIADTFRKSLRTPRWEEAPGVDDEEEEEEQDEARKAANELLRKELSEQGLDVQKTGVQRRVTIQTRPTGPEPDAAH